MTFYFLILFGLYFLLLTVLRIGWSRALSQKEKQPPSQHLFISVIIPIRNEANNISTLLMSLSQQRYPSSHREVILVDDHSTDDSMSKIDQQGRLVPNMTIVSLGAGGKGKKSALAHGIAQARGELIVTTDADCVLPTDWLVSINSFFQSKEVNMAAGMVVIADEAGYFSQWQAMEFASIVGTSTATFGLHKPLMCNGANLSFRKEIFQQVNGYEGNEHIASGDDEFLMRKMMSRYPGSVRLLNSLDAIVITRPQPSLQSFLQQRLRWASKWKGNPSWMAKLLAVYIFLTQISWVILLGFLFNNPILLGVAGIKIAADLIFNLPVFKVLKIRFRLLPFLGLQFLYPFYVVFVGLFAPFTGYRWKDRKIL
jgi:biofilm PGA synthesis N-glycosyltransferase PgaC